MSRAAESFPLVLDGDAVVDAMVAGVVGSAEEAAARLRAMAPVSCATGEALPPCRCGDPDRFHDQGSNPRPCRRVS